MNGRDDAARGRLFEEFLHGRLPGSILSPPKVESPDLYVPHSKTHIEAKRGTTHKGVYLKAPQIERFAQRNFSSLVYALGWYQTRPMIHRPADRRAAETELKKNAKIRRVGFISSGIVESISHYYTRGTDFEPVEQFLFSVQEHLHQKIIVTLPSRKGSAEDHFTLNSEPYSICTGRTHHNIVWDVVLHEERDARFHDYLQKIGILPER